MFDLSHSDRCKMESQSHISGVLFLEEAFRFMRSHLLIANLTACVISVLFMKILPVHSRLFLIFSSIRIRISGFMVHT